MPYLSDEDKARDVAKSLTAMRTAPTSATGVTQPTTGAAQASGATRSGPRGAVAGIQAAAGGTGSFVSDAAKSYEQSAYGQRGTAGDPNRSLALAYRNKANAAEARGNSLEAFTSGLASDFQGNVAAPIAEAVGSVGRFGREVTGSIGRGFGLDQGSTPIMGTPEQKAEAERQERARQAAAKQPVASNPVDAAIAAAASGKPAAPAKPLTARQYQAKFGQLDEGYFAQGGDRGLAAPTDPYGFASRLGLKADDPRVKAMTVARQEEEQRGYKDQLSRAYAANRISDEAFLADKNGYGSAGVSAAIAQAMGAQGSGPTGAEKASNDMIDMQAKTEALLRTSPEAQQAAAMSQIAGGDSAKLLDLQAAQAAATKPFTEQSVTKTPDGSETRTESSIPAYFAQKGGKKAVKIEPPASLAKNTILMGQLENAMAQAAAANASQDQKMDTIRQFLKDNNIQESYAHPFFLQYLQQATK